MPQSLQGAHMRCEPIGVLEYVVDFDLPPA